MSTADLARAINMSASSTADRVRRLTDQGVIQGYRAVVDPAALGYPLTAFIRVRLTTGVANPFRELLQTTPTITEAHHLTGDDCYLLKVLARSMPDLEELTGRLVTFGHLTTNIVFSSPVDGRTLPPAEDHA
ncbi:Lrp/AsnC family leucine-responsive transcriptional regulator [Saccharothrix violaceirubra]|uniref:Lrp/AsnC family leucine-responsive transcriptional regulator n=2 Tax=Saccharothrix violaceirubra TaxID=413306 RepID=A0A7W7WVP8_9PSEU|nr:Lrp/AsnC family leucine-responsive transcriptional regulator [Saccharothrix violaceirubra]